jgi:hypothetical protein
MKSDVLVDQPLEASAYAHRGPGEDRLPPVTTIYCAVAYMSPNCGD